MKNDKSKTTTLWSDKDIASELRMSASWVRKQRWLRRRGEDHVFRVDPVMIGKTPRYRHGDVQNWIEGLEGLPGVCNAI